MNRGTINPRSELASASFSFSNLVMFKVQFSSNSNRAVIDLVVGDVRRWRLRCQLTASHVPGWYKERPLRWVQFGEFSAIFDPGTTAIVVELSEWKIYVFMRLLIAIRNKCAWWIFRHTTGWTRDGARIANKTGYFQRGNTLINH